MNRIPHLVAAALLVMATNVTMAAEKASRVVVDKSDRQLLLYDGTELIGSYRIALGGSPVEPKRQEGDERTPEGTYVLDQKHAESRYYKAIHISYPNEYDAFLANQNQLSPGDDIMIHGQKNGFGGLAWITQRFDWTDGCIALSNEDMDKVWAAVDTGTPIEIKP